MLDHIHLLAQVLSLVMSSMYMCVSPSPIFYFDLSFTILSFFSLLHFEQHTELDNLIAMQNLRTSANKGSNDAYDVSVSLTSTPTITSEQMSGSFTMMVPRTDHALVLRTTCLFLSLCLCLCLSVSQYSHRVGSVALVHEHIASTHSACVHVTSGPTQPRWLKTHRKTESHLTW